jgi:hypothetical protein
VLLSPEPPEPEPPRADDAALSLCFLITRKYTGRMTARTTTISAAVSAAKQIKPRFVAGLLPLVGTVGGSTGRGEGVVPRSAVELFGDDGGYASGYEAVGVLWFRTRQVRVRGVLAASLNFPWSCGAPGFSRVKVKVSSR